MELVNRQEGVLPGAGHVAAGEDPQDAFPVAWLSVYPRNKVSTGNRREIFPHCLHRGNSREDFAQISRYSGL